MAQQISTTDEKEVLPKYRRLSHSTVVLCIGIAMGARSIIAIHIHFQFQFNLSFNVIKVENI